MTRVKYSAKKRNNESSRNSKFSFEIRLYVRTGILTAMAVFDRIPYLQFLYMKINIFDWKIVRNYFANHSLLDI